MEYVVVKISGESDIIGKLVLLDQKEMKIEDPVYVSLRPNMDGSLAIAMQRATLFAPKGEHILTLDIDKVLTYYNPSENVAKYYTEVIERYTDHHDEVFDKQVRGDYEEVEDSEDFIRKLSEFLIEKNANTAYH